MSRDLLLFELARKGTLAARVYSWEAPWVTLGRSQTEKNVLVSTDIPWITRPTGGGAVLHGHDLTLAIAYPFSRSVKDSYRISTRPILSALAAIGIPAILAEDLGIGEAVRGQGDCFLGRAANDIVDPNSGTKICGCALKRTSEAVLLQASIPIRSPLVEPERVFALPATPSWIELTEIDFARELNKSLMGMRPTLY
jgi:lipoate-protein ligase A